MEQFEIYWKRSAIKELKKIDPTVRTRLLEESKRLSLEPYPPGTRKLKGAEHTYRIRVGDYRIIYCIDEQNLQITIVRVRHRKDAYMQ